MDPLHKVAYPSNTELTRWLVLQKARRHPDLRAGLRLFVSIWFQILFHLPHRDTFHLSLTVLVHYRSLRIFSLGAIVAPDSNGISPVPPYLRIITHSYFIFTYGIFTLFGRSFQRRSVNKIIYTPIKRVRLPRNPTLRSLLRS